MYRDANAVLLTDQRASFVKGDPLPEYIRNLELAEMPAGRVTELMAYPDGDYVHLRVLTDSHHSIEPVELTCSGQFSILWERSYRKDMEEDWEDDEDDWNDAETLFVRTFPDIPSAIFHPAQLEQALDVLHSAERADILEEMRQRYSNWLRPDISTMRLLHFEQIIFLETDYADPNGDPFSSSFEGIHFPLAETTQETARRFVQVAPTVLYLDRHAANYFTPEAILEIRDTVRQGRWPGCQSPPIVAEEGQA